MGLVFGSPDVDLSTQIRTHTVTFGLAYKFGPPIAEPASAAPQGRLYGKAPVLAAAPANWSGFYLGGSLGAQWAQPEWTSSQQFPSTAVFADNFAVYDRSAVRLGGYGGWNYQVANFVLGVEADGGSVSNSRHEIVGIPGIGRGTFGPNPDRSSVEIGWDASVVARAGYLLASNVLTYVVGGVAWQEVEVSASCAGFADGGPFCFFTHSESKTKTLTGGTFGGGLEVALGQWLARADYRYAKFGRFKHTFFSEGDLIPVSVKVETHRASFGLAYKFGPSPIVAR